MSQHNRRGRGPTRLARIAETPPLSRVVPSLAPETLAQLIRQHGLDACGELVAAATPEQIAAVFDLDLWRGNRPGSDETFDADRFGEWLELLVDTGVAFAARTVAALDEQLIVAGLAKHVRVFDVAVFEPTAASDDESPVTAFGTAQSFECEVGGYLVWARDTRAWDAIVALLVALDAEHADCFHSVMSGCSRLSNSAPEIDGLDALLLKPEQHMHDVAVNREHRRARQGYSSPADARAFLQLARERRRLPTSPTTANPIVAAYRRAAGEAVPIQREHLEVDPIFERPRALLQGTRRERPNIALIQRLMQYVAEHSHAAYLERGAELGFLANTLAAGSSIQGRSFTPQEAVDAAVGVCNLGLEQWPALRDAFLENGDLVNAFEIGWGVLHEHVCMFVAERLLAVLKDLRCVGADIQIELHTLRKALARQREAGTPWHAREALEVLAMLDVPAWASLAGLLNECPVVPAALTATLERRTGAVSATAFEFISTTTQLATIRRFVALLPECLGGSH